MKHLSSEEISRVVSGDLISEENHLRQCPACSMEVERLQGALRGFGDSIRTWSEMQNPLEIPLFKRKERRIEPLAWLLAATALAVVVAVPVYQNSKERELRSQAERDAQLTDDVNAQLSRHAPVAMQPLMRMMAVKGAEDDSARPTEMNINESHN